MATTKTAANRRRPGASASSKSTRAPNRRAAGRSQASDLSLLRDRLAISDLILSFAYAVDTRDHRRYCDNFTPDGVLELPFGRFEGRSAIEAMQQPKIGNGSHHLSSNHMIAIDGDTASARSYVIATHIFDLAKPRDIAQAGGWYDYELRRTPKGWRFARVKLTIVWETADMMRG